MAAMLYPGFCFTVFFAINSALRFVGSTAAVSFGPLATLILLWALVQAPLVFIGRYVTLTSFSDTKRVLTRRWVCQLLALEPIGLTAAFSVHPLAMPILLWTSLHGQASIAARSLCSS